MGAALCFGDTASLHRLEVALYVLVQCNARVSDAVSVYSCIARYNDPDEYEHIESSDSSSDGEVPHDVPWSRWAIML